ncbi:hypothetical protein ABPG72_020784 [Tetrahymena utriculariae]
MEKELKILKRQNKNNDYERLKFNNLNINDSFSLEQTLRILEKSIPDINQSEQSISSQRNQKNFNSFQFNEISDFNIPLIDSIGAECEKNMNFNKDPNHIYSNLNYEEQLKKVQKEKEQFKANQMKSNREILIDKLKSEYDECFFGMTISSQTVAYQSYNDYCQKQKEMKLTIDFSNQQFQIKFKGSHIKTNEIPEKYYTGHLISCGVQPIKIIFQQNNPITQHISYICFDSIDKLSNLTSNLVEQEEEVQQKVKHTDL